MSYRAWVIGSAFLLTLASGCIVPLPQDATGTATVARGPGDVLLPVLPLPGLPVAAAKQAGGPSSTGADDLLQLDVASDGSGKLTAFHWTIPEGALASTADGTRSLFLEVAPLLSPGVPEPEQWGLMVFADRPDGLAHVGSLLVPTLTEERLEAGQVIERSTRAPGPSPFVLEVGQASLSTPRTLAGNASVQEGEALYLVLGVRGGPGQVPFVVRVLDHAAPSGSQGDPEAFGQVLAGRGPVPLPVVAGEDGFRILAYQEHAGMADTTVQGRRAYTDGLYFRDTSNLWPNTGLPRYRTLEVRMESIPWDYQGWGITAFATSGQSQTGNWTLRAEAFGQSFEDQGLVYNSDAQQDSGFVTGEPSVLLVGDGPGIQRTTLRLRSVHGSQDESVLLFQACMGASLRQLLGTPGVEEVLGAPSLTGIGWGIVFG